MACAAPVNLAEETVARKASARTIVLAAPSKLTGSKTRHLPSFPQHLLWILNSPLGFTVNRDFARPCRKLGSFGRRPSVAAVSQSNAESDLVEV